MAEILELLFDHYTRSLDMSQVRQEKEKTQAKYEQLKVLVGEENAVELWDAATAEGSVMEEVCFLAGVKLGMELARELSAL